MRWGGGGVGEWWVGVEVVVVVVEEGGGGGRRRWRRERDDGGKSWEDESLCVGRGLLLRGLEEMQWVRLEGGGEAGRRRDGEGVCGRGWRE